ncbi:MAG: 2Fe-2S iron-sulfur cluster-binding protein [Chromatiales bacterium]|nr:2Fe-2S iron-sulfur cluster-binding protein [Chromatiales bacterium]
MPRFCYHEKLSIAANCRMCLVEVEKAPKPLPACATPVAEGMKVFTKSPRAIARAEGDDGVPADQPPARLPDLRPGRRVRAAGPRDGLRPRRRRATASASASSRTRTSARSISTDMTRCIHCTRCVRFGQEIAGVPELGTIGRGERMQIIDLRREAASITSCRATSSTCARSAR